MCLLAHSVVGGQPADGWLVRWMDRSPGKDQISLALLEGELSALSPVP